MTTPPPTEPNAETVQSPFECENCGHKPTPKEVVEHQGSCRKCGDTVTTYTVDAAECILRHESAELKRLRKIEAAAKNAVRCYDERDVISQSVVEYLRDALKGESK